MFRFYIQIKVSDMNFVENIKSVPKYYGCGLQSDLHELITSPVSKNVYIDVAVQFDEGELIWTSKGSLQFKKI